MQKALLWNWAGVQAGVARSIADWQQMMGLRPVEFWHYADQQAARFYAQHHTVVLDDVMVSRMSTAAHHVQRPVRTDAESYVQIGLQLRGWSNAYQGARQVVSRPGDLIVFSTDVDFRVDLSEGMGCVLFLLPARALGLSDEVIRKQSLAVIRGDAGLGLLMARTLGTLGDDLATLTGRGATRVVSSMASLAAAMLLREAEQRDAITSVGIEDVCGFIDAHLGDSSLTAQRVADAHFIALRTLQYQLQREGTTVSRLIRERRLDRARRDIGDPHDPRPIAEIAKACGFASPAHFSREFKQAYGASPSDYRRSRAATTGSVTTRTAT